MTRRPLLPVVALALLAAACGDGGGASPSTTVVAGPLTTGTVPLAVAPRPSPGCRDARDAVGRDERDLLHAGQERRYERGVRPGPDPGAPPPLLLVVGDGAVPDGPGAAAAIAVAEGDDASLVGAVLADVAASTCVDLARTAVAGRGAGLPLVVRFACDDANDVTVLVGLDGLADPADCTPHRPVPVVAVAPEASPDLEAAAQGWAARNDCRATPQREEADGVTVATWTGCDQGATVEVAVGPDDAVARARAALDRQAPR